MVIIQGSWDTVFDGDPARSQRAFAEYRELSRQAVATHKDIDLVIWPESMFSLDIIRYDDNVPSPPYWQGHYTIPETARILETQAKQMVSELGTACLVGTNELHCGATEMLRYNAAGFYRRDGTLMGVGQAMIRLENVRKSYRTNSGYNHVLANVTAHFPRGRKVGILGVNGSGKSTLLRMIGGSEHVDGGRITRNGTVSWPIGFGGGMNPNLTGRENARFVARIHDFPASEVESFVHDYSELDEYFEMRVST